MSQKQTPIKSLNLRRDYLETLGYLALGSRLRRLSDRLAQEVSAIYEEGNFDFQPRWFPVFRCVAAAGKTGLGITDIAEAVGITHPAVNQLEQELSAHGLISVKADPNDKRRRLLCLSSRGEKLFKELEETWSNTHAAISEAAEESQLLSAIIAFERALNQEPLTRRTKRLAQSLSNAKPKIISYQNDLAQHFIRLNKAWIIQHFCLEAADHQLFKDPGQIVKAGGQILFIELGEKIVGTCALIKTGKHNFELAKMAIDEAYRDRGLGRALLKAAIAEARKMGATSISLETNSKLHAAVALYKKLGFKQIPTKHTDFVRVDISMKLELL